MMKPSTVYDPHSNSSSISLLPKPKLTSHPSIFATLLDKYWKNYTSDVIKQADRVMWKGEQLKKQDIHIDPMDQKRIFDAYKGVQMIVKDYQSAVKRKMAKQAQTLSLEIASRVSELEDRASASHIKAMEQKSSRGYTVISDGVSQAMIFNRGLRYTVSCDLCARQDSVERAIRWFEASHRSKPVHWVKGGKGSGKTVLLRHIAKKCAVQTNLPIATITFSDSPCGTLQHFIEHFLATVLDQLATRIPGLQDSLTSIGNEWLATNTSYANMPFEQQVDDLFISPLAQLISPGSQRPVLIIIDGLDHCDIGALDTLLEFMETTIPELPVYFIISGSHEDPDARTESRVCARLARRRIRKYLDENEVESFDHVLERLSPSASGSP